MFNLKIDTSNPAFGDPSTPDHSFTRGREVVRLLKEAIRKVDGGWTGSLLRDTNGYNVGEWVFTDSQEPEVSREH